MNIITKDDANIFLLDTTILYADLAKNVYLDKAKKVINTCNAFLLRIQEYAIKDSKMNYLLKETYEKEFMQRVLLSQAFDKLYYLSATNAYMKDYGRFLSFSDVINLYQNIQIIKYHYETLLTTP